MITMPQNEIEKVAESVKGLGSVESVETRGSKRVRVRLRKDGLGSLCEGIMKLGFDHCSCISTVDNIDHFTIVYSFWSTKKKCGLDAYIDFGKDEHVPSISKYYGGANWHERESFDMMGVVFDGHPNLKRVLLSEDADYFPLRKDYKPQPEKEGPIDAAKGT